MKKLRKQAGKHIQKLIDWISGNGLMQEELEASGIYEISEEMKALARRCAAEGCVLLENDGTLPLRENSPVAVFGRCQLDWFYVGYGSGGDVHPPYRVDLMAGLQNRNVPVDREVATTYRKWCSSEENMADHGWWGHWPMCHPEMELDPEFVTNAASRAQTALIVIGRAAGEDRENTLTPGSYYLTDTEKYMLDTVSTAFSRTVVILNIGSIMDMRWIADYGDRLSAVLLVWQGGMESGNAVADVLTGAVNPCGKLADTVACAYEDYPSSNYFGGKGYNCYAEDIYVGYRYFDTFAPDKICYPMGYGLSYTDFSLEGLGLSADGDKYTARVCVRNTGPYAGREVVPLYCSMPQGKLGKPAKVLTAFAKTKILQPGESQTLQLHFDERCMASYDDTGITGFPDAFVLEAGTYRFYAGKLPVGILEVEKTRVVSQCSGICSVKEPFRRMVAQVRDGKFIPDWEELSKDPAELKQRILDQLPEQIPFTGDLGYKLSDVAKGSVTLESFIAQLTEPELEALSRGEGTMGSSLGTAGNAGAFGGILPSLREKGIPPVITADGPSGLRLKRYCALLPSGTALACTWDDALVEELYGCIGEEMIRQKLDVVLSPGMNIHRNPLCGRNFEYFSEDPLLTGKIAAAVIRGVQSRGASCCPKHFACNNQEVRRNTNDSRVSVRTLREIYLRGFEIAVKEGRPNTLMTSYNKVNGVWSHYNFDLATTVLRKEWGFDGVVLTDWWMQRSVSPEFPAIRDNAYRVRAQVDVLMPGNMARLKKTYCSDGTLLESLGKPGGITRGELQRCAENVLRLILKIKREELLKA